MKSAVLVTLAVACSLEPLELPALRFDVENAKTDSVSVEGIVAVTNEVVLYDSAEAKELRLIYPYCISAISPTGSETEYRKYEGRKVRLEGRRVAFKKLHKEESIGSTLYFFGKRSVSNWCFGDYVIVIDKMTPTN